MKDIASDINVIDSHICRTTGLLPGGWNFNTAITDCVTCHL